MPRAFVAACIVRPPGRAPRGLDGRSGRASDEGMQSRGKAGGTSGRASDPERQRCALLAAGEAVITEKGFARTTVEDIAERARVGTEVFYAHFQGLGAMLRALSGQFVEQMTAATEQSTGRGIWTGAEARDVVDVAVRTILDVVIDRQGLVRALLAHGATDASLAADLRAIGTHFSQRLIAVLGECTNLPARPSRAIAFSLLVAVALAHHHILVGDEWSGVSFSKEQLAEECTRAICAYLDLQPTTTMRRDTRDAAPTEMIAALGTAEIEIVKE